MTQRTKMLDLSVYSEESVLSVCTIIWRTSVHNNFLFFIRERYVLAYSMVNPWSDLLCFLWWIGFHICVRTCWYMSFFWLFLRN